jgi:hypothetical protein
VGASGSRASVRKIALDSLGALVPAALAPITRTT